MHKLNEKFEHGNIGLYRDDGLAVFENLSGRAADKARKEFTRIFGDLALKITIQSNVKVADFLDVTLNLSNGKYYPFSKPNNEPVYINAKSNHPPIIIKHLPAAINRRISNLSCNEEEFHKASGPYNAALRASQPTESNQTRSCNCRKPEMCPLDGQCLTDNLVYKATVKADNRPEKIYIGMTENTFKTRFNGHKVSLKHKSHRNDTTLSKYIWELKDNGTNFNIH